MRMRGWALFAATVLAATIVRAGAPQEKLQCVYGGDQSVSGGDSVPWPWGNEIDLPWDNMDGIWRVVKSNCDSYFAFVPTKRKVSAGTHLTQVTQYDANTCEKIAWGYGTDNDRVLRSSMSNGRQSFSLTVRAFPRTLTQITPKVSGTIAEKSVIVLTMYPKRAWDQRISFELEKVSGAVKPTCQTQVVQ